jgi:hypothetical protein
MGAELKHSFCTHSFGNYLLDAGRYSRLQLSAHSLNREWL